MSVCKYIPKSGPNEGKECGKECKEGREYCKKHNPERMRKRILNKIKRNKRFRLKKERKGITIPKKDSKGNKLNADVLSFLANLKL